uniref:Uncharacterized protein n=1 Tax=Oryza punctata TaxID=4537 RepID=A0A0E0MEZ6_ORYPU
MTLNRALVGKGLMVAATGGDEDTEEMQGYRIRRMATREAKNGCRQHRTRGPAMGAGHRRGFQAIAAAAMHKRLHFVDLQRNLDGGRCIVKMGPSIGCDGWWRPPISRWPGGSMLDLSPCIPAPSSCTLCRLLNETATFTVTSVRLYASW